MAYTLAHQLVEDYQAYAARPCVAVKVGGRFVDRTYREIGREAAGVAVALLERGVRVGDRVAIVSRSRLEWLLADQAIAFVGAIVVPIYPTLVGPVLEHVLRDSGATLAFVEGRAEAERVRAAAPGIRIVSIDDAAGAADPFPRRPESLDDPRLRRRLAELTPATRVSFLYTSGTTGMPKGALYDHDRAQGLLKKLRVTLALEEGDVALSFLPMSHALGRGSAIVYFHAGVKNCIGESIDTIAQDLALARPTVAFAVPRVFEKAYERILAAAGASPVKRRLFAWALDAARRDRPWRRLADRIVFSKIRARFGGKIRTFWSGGASLPAHIAEFFHLAGVPIRDIYGMSEFGISHAAPVGEIRYGSCGKTAAGYESKIAEDGELLVRCEHAMLGYHGLPEETAEFRDADGWMHTGDIGRIDGDGFLFITDRKKSLLVLSNGKKVAPAPIESELTACGWVLQAVVLGEGRSYLTALVAPNRERAAAEGIDDAALRARIQAAVDAVNAGRPSFETIKRFALLGSPLSEEAGELTPSLKVKRAEVARLHARAIDELYR